jgi:hypothetical protein
MEEILASIRRIIADDDAAKNAPAAPAADPPPPPAAAARAPLAPSRPAPAAPPPQRPVSPPEPKLMQEEIDALMLPAEPPAERTNSGVLDLTEAMAAPGSARNEGFRTIDGQSDIVFEETSQSREAPPARRPAEERPLISSSTSAAVDSAFNSLAQSVLVQNARTLEDLVREMLRPMLKSWLDDNLPGLVERLVRAEIERVSRGR